LDPKTATGLVEPIRTEDGHQRRGLARHLITYGISRLAAAGACRVKVCFKRDNPIAGRLYLSVGFEANKHTVAFTCPVPASR
ncbi:MAG: GNAT family N-acetyltransferase, partial [Pseudomonadota bacterium]